MKNLLVVALLLAAGSVALSQAQNEKQPSEKPSGQWEYKAEVIGVTSDTNRHLNQSAKDGWEIDHLAGEADRGFLFVFKRPVAADPREDVAATATPKYNPPTYFPPETKPTLRR